MRISVCVLLSLFMTAAAAAQTQQFPTASGPAGQSVGSTVGQFVNPSGQAVPDSAANPHPVNVIGQSNYNGSGSTTHSAVTTAYSGTELFAANTTGNAVPSQITVTGTTAGTGLIDKGLVQSSGTMMPPTIVLWLFSAAPTATGLVDRSTYVGPYAADITSGIYIGSLTCATWNKTNDASAQYFSECTSSNGVFGPIPFKAAAGQTYLYALEEINGSYTPLSAETHTYLLSTLRDN